MCYAQVKFFRFAKKLWKYFNNLPQRGKLHFDVVNISLLLEKQILHKKKKHRSVSSFLLSLRELRCTSSEQTARFANFSKRKIALMLRCSSSSQKNAYRLFSGALFPVKLVLLHPKNNKKKKHRSVSSFLLSLRELRCTTSFLQAVLLSFLCTRVSR